MILNTAMQTALNKGAYEPRYLVWMSPKDRSTGTKIPYGFHTGLDPLTVTINGENRTYDGAGELLSIPNFKYEAGLDVVTERLRLSILSPDVTNAIRAYDARLAQIEVHLVLIEPSTQSILGSTLMFEGQVDDIQINEDEYDAYCEVGIVQSIRAGTKPMTLMKSHESQLLRDPDDNSFKYASIAGTTKIQWGTPDGGWQVPRWRNR